MLRTAFLFCLLISSSFVNAQTTKSYSDSIFAYRKDYTENHEVVKDDDKKYFRFFPIDSTYRVICRFEKIEDKKGFLMKSSGTIINRYFKFGILNFTLHDTAVSLYIYQNKSLMKNPKYKDYLFVPYTDNTSGYESHGSGRYLDLSIGDIKNNTVILDFNKAYNPYCAYSSGYSCPIPPKENDLPVSVKAGEMEFAKPF